MSEEKQLKRYGKKFKTNRQIRSENKAIHDVEKIINFLHNKLRTVGIFTVYDGQQLHFTIPDDTKRKCSIDFETNGKMINGCYYYGSNPMRFKFDPTIFQYDPESFRTVIHETCHSLQDDLAMSIDNYKTDSPEYQYILKIKAVIDCVQCDNIMGFQIDGQIYFGTAAESSYYSRDTVADAFYRLLITERFAEKTAMNYTNMICEKMVEDWKYDRAIEVMKEHYFLDNLTNQEICELIDNCCLNIYLNQEPRSWNEANVMYDMLANLSYQHNYLSLNEYLHATEYDVKMEKLAEYCYLRDGSEIKYDVTNMTNDLNTLKYLSLHNIKSLSPGQKINNPKMLIAAISNEGIRAANLIPSIKALKDWCYSKHNHYDDSVMRRVEKVLGSDFSPEKCKEQQELNAQKEQAEIERRRKKIEQLNEKYIERYHFDEFDFDNPIDLRNKKREYNFKEKDNRTIDDGVGFDSQEVDFHRR